MLYSTAGCFLASCACIQPESLGCALSCLVELQFHLLWLPSRERTQSSKMLLDPSERKQEHSGHLEVKVRTPSLSFRNKSILMMLYLLQMHTWQGYLKAADSDSSMPSSSPHSSYWQKGAAYASSPENPLCLAGHLLPCKVNYTE